MAKVTVDEDLARQAATARRLAPALCGPTGCGWYHGVWPALRAHGLVASPHRNGTFFAAALGDAASAGLTRVLVTGAADAAMLGIVLAAYDEAGVVPEVTVLDKCPTPVEVSVEEARAHGIEVAPWVEDVTIAGRDGAFDVVVTHGLFPMVARSERPAVAQAWARLLRGGGRLVTTSSVAGPDAPERSSFAPDAVEAFAARARAVGGDELASDARGWAERVVAEPVRSTDEIGDLLTAAGFDVAVATREIEGALGASGPWSARAATYAEIVATRLA